MRAPEPEIARLKITLDEIKPRIWRQIEVPLGIRLDELHLVIQEAMGWENAHLYEFRAGGSSWGIADEELGVDYGDGPLPAKRATLGELVGGAGKKTFKYLYDFGDGWEHSIRVERLIAADPDSRYPRLLAAKRGCPPEDCGGPWGYTDYLEAITDPNHENHDEMIEWRGPGFDPEDANEAGIRKRLDRLATRLSRRKVRRAERRGKIRGSADA
jgi:hypothetical protein